VGEPRRGERTVTEHGCIKHQRLACRKPSFAICLAVFAVRAPRAISGELPPVSAHPHVTVAVPHPARSDPHGVRIRPDHVPASHPNPTHRPPIPVTGCPNISRAGRRWDYLSLRRGWRLRCLRRYLRCGSRSGRRLGRRSPGVGLRRRCACSRCRPGVSRLRGRGRHVNHPVFDAPIGQGSHAAKAQGQKCISSHNFHRNHSSTITFI
jgi:hypothetical protein